MLILKIFIYMNQTSIFVQILPMPISIFLSIHFSGLLL
ncbi:hypothetical protein pah_c008o073 [Parachlamydia acanthamoebae str. Hall's coccus]|nr:hypothetical protein pah_c008o073 [Parachlamydia acanthamoebae str. Hall's coccus]